MGGVKRAYEGASASKAKRVRSEAAVKIQKAYKGYKYKRTLPVPEKKEAQQVQAFTDIQITTPTSLVVLINGVATGTDTTNRIGRKVTSQYIEIKVCIQCGISNTLGDCGFWAIVLDRQSDGAAPAFSDIFDTSTAIATPGLAPRNTVLNAERFLILAIEQWAVAIGQQTPPYYCQRFIDLRRLSHPDSTTNFNGTGATVSSIGTGGIFFVAASTLATNTANFPTRVAFGSKYRFIDM